MSKPYPRVLLLGLNYPPEPTGISPYTGSMARGLARRGFLTRVLTAHPHYPDWKVRAGYGQWTLHEEDEGVGLTRVRHYVPEKPHGLHRLISEWTFGARLRAARWGRPDVVVAISPAMIASVMAAVRARLFHRHVPFVVWVQDIYTLGMAETQQGGGFALRVISTLEGWLLRQADCVVVIHDRFAARIHRDFGVSLSNIRVIRNWTHLSESPPVDIRAARLRFGWKEHEVVALHAGNMGVKQGLDNVVEAARIAEQKGQHVRFVLLGAGSEADRLKKLGQGITTLQFIDPLDDGEFTAALAAADCLVVNELPGVSEMAVPSKLTSYFAAGKPVVAATDVDGITAEEVLRADAGLVVHAGDPAALLGAVRAVAADVSSARRMGENGHRYRDAVLGEETAITAFADMLEGLLHPDGAVESEHTDGTAVATSSRN